MLLFREYLRIHEDLTLTLLRNLFLRHFQALLSSRLIELSRQISSNLTSPLELDGCFTNLCNNPYVHICNRTHSLKYLRLSFIEDIRKAILKLLIITPSIDHYAINFLPIHNIPHNSGKPRTFKFLLLILDLLGIYLRLGCSL